MEKAVMSLFLIFLLFTDTQGLCQFSGLIASCDMTLGGLPVVAYARVNHCHAPIDITFQVHGQPPVSNLSWRYTYVTTNSAENAALSQHIMLAMVANQDASGERLSVQARFLLDGTAGGPELAFLDDELLLPPTSQEECLLAATATGGGHASGWVAGACLLGLGVATVVVAVTIFKSRQSRRQGNNSNSSSTNGSGGQRGGFGMFRRRRGGGGTGGTVVQYVVPADTPQDLKLYVSTGEGLQPIVTATNSETNNNRKSTKKQPKTTLPSPTTNGFANEGFQLDDSDAKEETSSGETAETVLKVSALGERSMGARPKVGTSSMHSHTFVGMTSGQG